MTNITPGDRDVSRFNAAIRQLYQGGSNNTGVVTLRASQTTTVVNHESINPNSHISLTPLTLNALLAMQPTLTYSPPVLTALVPKIITLTRVLSAANGNVSYTGVGFKPSLVHFEAGLPSTNVGYNSIGSDDGTNHSSISILGGGTANSLQTGGSIFAGDNAAGTNFQSAFIATMDADGFTLTWTKNGTPTATATVRAICFPPADSATSGSASLTNGGVRVSARTTGSFTLTHPSNAAVDQNFTYSVTGGS